MSYQHLTISERSKIETYVELGYSSQCVLIEALPLFQENYVAIQIAR